MKTIGEMLQEIDMDTMLIVCKEALKERREREKQEEEKKNRSKKEGKIKTRNRWRDVFIAIR